MTRKTFTRRDPNLTFGVALILVIIGSVSSSPVAQDNNIPSHSLDPLEQQDVGLGLSSYIRTKRNDNTDPSEGDYETSESAPTGRRRLAVGIGSAINISPVHQPEQQRSEESMIEFKGGRMIRRRQTPGLISSSASDSSSTSTSESGSSEGGVGGIRNEKRFTGGIDKVADRYRSVKKLDYAHPYRKKVRPVGKFLRK